MTWEIGEVSNKKNKILEQTLPVSLLGWLQRLQAQVDQQSAFLLLAFFLLFF